MASIPSGPPSLRVVEPPDGPLDASDAAAPDTEAPEPHEPDTDPPEGPVDLHLRDDFEPPATRTPEQREALAQSLRRIFGVETEEEELLLEPVVALTWRLRGIDEEVERLEAWQRAAMVRAAWTEEPFGQQRAYDERTALTTSSSTELLTAQHHLARLMAILQDGEPLTRDHLREHYYAAVGWERAHWGEGDLPTLTNQLEVLTHNDKGPEWDALRTRTSAMLDALGEAVAERRWGLIDHEEELRLLARRQSWPEEEQVVPLLRARPSVARELEDARRTLREAVGRRRLRAIAVMWLGR